MFGGWRTSFTIGYGLPLKDFLFQSEGKRFLNISFGSPIRDLVIDNLIVKVMVSSCNLFFSSASCKLGWLCFCIQIGLSNKVTLSSQACLAWFELTCKLIGRECSLTDCDETITRFRSFLFLFFCILCCKMSNWTPHLRNWSCSNVNPFWHVMILETVVKYTIKHKPILIHPWN